MQREGDRFLFGYEHEQYQIVALFCQRMSDV